MGNAAATDGGLAWSPLALPEWLRRPLSNSDHVLCHRAATQLEAMGLIERRNPKGGRRTTHLKLTSAGRCVAEELATAECGVEDGDSEDLVDWAAVELMPIEWPLSTSSGADSDDE